MFSCNNCSLSFNTREELAVHTETCNTNVAGPSSSTCKHCNMSLTTELSEHYNNCNVVKELVISDAIIMRSLIDEYIEHRSLSEGMPCKICSEKVGTMGDLIRHRNKCGVLLVRSLIDDWIRLAKVRYIAGCRNVLSVPVPQSLSEGIHEERDISEYVNTNLQQLLDYAYRHLPKKQMTFSKTMGKYAIYKVKKFQKKALDTGKNITAESSPEKKEEFECVICIREFQSEDDLRTHIIECHNTDDK